MDGLLRALQSNFGGDGPTVHDPGTVVGVLSLARSWLSGDIDPEELLQAIEDLVSRARAAADETRRDLNKPLEPELVRLLSVLAEIFEAIEAAGLSFFSRVQSADPGVEELMGELEILNQDLTATRHELEEWVRAPVPRCLRCGSRGAASVCESCGLDRLIPDPEAGEDLQQSAVLGPEFFRLYRAYRSVVDGEAPLASALAAMGPLETLMKRLSLLAPRTNPELEGPCVEALMGLDQMRRAVSTRQVRDLNQGWDRIFQAALAMRDLLPQMLRQGGREAEAANLEQQRRSEDAISFGF